MARYLLFSHDGFGLGHVRRNSIIAREISGRDRRAQVTIATGVPCAIPWPLPPRSQLAHLPPLVKDSRGLYVGVGMNADSAADVRRHAFARLVADLDPDVLLVDRHPYGAAGELRAGVRIAHRRGTQLVLGLRDVLDEPEVVRREFDGRGWQGFESDFGTVLVYGARFFCDHAREYGLAVAPSYCGWVVESQRRQRLEPRLLVVAAGGGGDGSAVYEMGIRALAQLPDWRAQLLVGPLAARERWKEMARQGDACRITVRQSVGGCAPAFARAQAVLLMAGYNSALEALATGQRPIFLPRRHPRLEQGIRAERLARLGLGDLVVGGASADDVARLIEQPRSLGPGELARAGITLDGGERAAEVLVGLAHQRART